MKKYYVNLEEKFMKEEALNEAIASGNYVDYDYEGANNERIYFEFDSEKERNKFALKYFGIEMQTVEVFE